MSKPPGEENRVLHMLDAEEEKEERCAAKSAGPSGAKALTDQARRGAKEVLTEKKHGKKRENAVEVH